MSRAEHSDQRVREAGAADAAERVPIDHFLETGRGLVALLVEERGFDSGTEEETADGDDADER
eukprot:CAMPEP_0117590506 /NCGR_PEP_ID=MMETSP0784-20121206/71015_1 /TAXON_ID=39447 /ORGANISM="" /LENGTH=62 /DNA_ID=CAMNT_0005392125 /DNA_START=73 /DNA_END=257 /DNA_ORIENTATION=+